MSRGMGGVQPHCPKARTLSSLSLRAPQNLLAFREGVAVLAEGHTHGCWGALGPAQFPRGPSWVFPPKSQILP